MKGRHEEGCPEGSVDPCGRSDVGLSPDKPMRNPLRSPLPHNRLLLTSDFNFLSFHFVSWTAWPHCEELIDH